MPLLRDLDALVSATSREGYRQATPTERAMELGARIPAVRMTRLRAVAQVAKLGSVRWMPVALYRTIDWLSLSISSTEPRVVPQRSACMSLRSTLDHLGP